MNILCLICGREGSKGIKNKNMISVNNKKLIDITINQAILMFTALSYIALFFVQYANFMIGLLLEQDEEC